MSELSDRETKVTLYDAIRWKKLDDPRAEAVFGNDRTIMAMRNFDLPGIWGVNFGVGAGATQFGFVIEPDNHPGPIALGIVEAMSSLASEYDIVIMSEQTLEDLNNASTGLLYSEATEIRWARGSLVDQAGNGFTITGGWGLVGGSVSVNDDQEFQAISLLHGPTFGIKAATVSTSVIYFDFDEMKAGMKAHFHNNYAEYETEVDSFDFVGETGFTFNKRGQFQTEAYDQNDLVNSPDKLRQVRQKYLKLNRERSLKNSGEDAEGLIDPDIYKRLLLSISGSEERRKLLRKSRNITDAVYFVPNETGGLGSGPIKELSDAESI